MDDMHLYAVLLIEMLCGVLGAIDGAVFAASASEVDLHVGESAGDEAFDVEVDEFVDALEEGEYLSVAL